MAANIDTVLATLRELDAHDAARSRRLLEGTGLATSYLAAVLRATTLAEAHESALTGLSEITEAIREP